MFATGKINVKDDELDAMLKEASGPINFTMFLNMFGEKLTGEPPAVDQHSMCLFRNPDVSHKIQIFRSLEKPWDLAFWAPHVWAPTCPVPPCGACELDPQPQPTSCLPAGGLRPSLSTCPSSGPGRDPEDPKNSCPGQGQHCPRHSGAGEPVRLRVQRERLRQPEQDRSLWAGTDTEETILNAFKMLDPEGKGSINKD